MCSMEANESIETNNCYALPQIDESVSYITASTTIEPDANLDFRYQSDIGWN